MTIYKGKKRYNRLLSALLALAICAALLCAAPTTASAQDSGVTEFSSASLGIRQSISGTAEAADPLEVITVRRGDPKAEITLPGGIDYGYNWVSDPANSSEDEAEMMTAIYNGFVRAFEKAYYSETPYKNKQFVEYLYITELVSLDVSAFELRINTDSEGQPVNDEVYFHWVNMVEVTIRAVQTDNPQYFFVIPLYGFSYKDGYITEIIPCFSVEHAEQSERQAAAARIADKLAEYKALTDTVDTVYDKLHLVYDKILAERDYQFTDGDGLALPGTGLAAEIASYTQSITGVMDTTTPGPVCVAYARAFSYICNSLGIAKVLCVTGVMNGAGHEWNYVEIDGKYYMIDITSADLDWMGLAASDDAGNTVNMPSYQFFLVGTKNPHAGISLNGVNLSGAEAAGYFVEEFSAGGYRLGLPENLAEEDYPRESEFTYITDNGCLELGLNLRSDIVKNVFAPTGLLIAQQDVTFGNPLWYGSDEYGYMFNFGPYYFGNAEKYGADEIVLYRWDFDKTQVRVSLQFPNEPVKLTEGVDYYVQVEDGQPGDVVHAWIYGMGSYRGITFVNVELPYESTPLPGADFENPFTDVKTTDWFYDYVEFVSTYDPILMQGTSQASFSPNSPLTRAMVYTILARLEGVEITGENWIQKAIEFAIPNGISDGTNPTGFVTRRQLATMLYRFAGIGSDGWNGEAMAWAKSAGLINDGRPEDSTTRAEMAAVISRFVRR